MKRELKEAKEAKRRERQGPGSAVAVEKDSAEPADDDLFTVKSVYNWAASSSGGGAARGKEEEEDEDSDAVDVGAKKRKALKIRFDGKAKAMIDAGAKKTR